MLPAVFSSLRVRLLCVFLLGVLPALGLALYLGVEYRRQAMAKAHADALQLARAAAADQERVIESERQLLVAIAALPEVRGGDMAACQARFADLLRQHPRFANLAVTTPDGYTTCSALPFTPPVRTTHRMCYRRVLASRTFVVGDYQVGTITGKATINVAYPVLGEADQLLAILTAALDVGWLNQLLAETHLPEAATLSIIDRRGTMVARHPDPEWWVGRSVADAPIVQTVLAQGEGAAALPGPDGMTRLFAFKPLVGSGRLPLCVRRCVYGHGVRGSQPPLSPHAGRARCRCPGGDGGSLGRRGQVDPAYDQGTGPGDRAGGGG